MLDIGGPAGLTWIMGRRGETGNAVAMDTALIRKYDRPVPRYTSYPTAPHFHGGVGADTAARWLAEIDPDLPLSLYIHIPYCDTLCWFCGCHTKIVRRYQPVAAYLKLVEKEIEIVARSLGRRHPVAHVHFGGGSPTILKGDDVRRLGDGIRGRFAVAEDAEWAVEIDPRDLRDDVLHAFAEIGVNRASIGLQDVNPLVQQAINRIQPMEETAAVVADLRAAGVKALNVDLMYGLPHQTIQHVVRTVEAALDLEPDRLALFGYAHVPHMKTHMKMIPEKALPDGPARFEQAEVAARRLVEAGFRRIGLDHFAHAGDPLAVALDKGRLRRNFQGYTTDQASALVGLGASAIGSLPQGYLQNEVPLHAYRDAVEAGRLAVARGVALSADDIARRDGIERLMCTLSLDVADLRKTHGLAGNAFSREMAALAPMQADGLVELGTDGVRVTEAGRPFMRCVAAVFDAYLGQGNARHARAV